LFDALQSFLKRNKLKIFYIFSSDHFCVNLSNKVIKGMALKTPGKTGPDEVKPRMKGETAMSRSLFLERIGKKGTFRRTGRTCGARIRRSPFSLRGGFLCGIYLAGLSALVLMGPWSAFAHPPGDVNLSYLKDQQALQVTITHSTPFPGSHYVKKVQIQKNRDKPEIYEYKNQPDKSRFVYVYKMTLADGDRVEVKVFCNIYGTRAASLVMPGPAAR